MNLNHLNLVVRDVASCSQFFETYFGFECTELKGDNIIAILKGSDGFSLVLMASKGIEPTYPEAFHIGFMLESVEAVSASFEKLRHAGIAQGDGPKKIRDSYGFYFRFENLMIEVGHY